MTSSTQQPDEQDMKLYAHDRDIQDLTKEIHNLVQKIDNVIIPKIQEHSTILIRQETFLESSKFWVGRLAPLVLFLFVTLQSIFGWFLTRLIDQIDADHMAIIEMRTKFEKLEKRP